MKKIIIVLCLVCVTLLVFSQQTQNSASQSVKATVKDTLYLNNKTTVKLYHLVANLPKSITETVVSPKLNQGEIYHYDFVKNQKSIYYPLLKQSVVTDMDSNYIKIVLDIVLHSTVSAQCQVSKNSDGNVERISFPKDQIEIKLSEYHEVSKVYIPNSIVVYQTGNILEKLELSNIEINQGAK